MSRTTDYLIALMNSEMEVLAMLKKLKTCSDCRGHGYLHMLGRRHGDAATLVPCDCRDGRRFLRIWKQELDKLSPPTKLKSGDVDTEGD